jgi:caa(3)-type oxidase subunit IV
MQNAPIQSNLFSTIIWLVLVILTIVTFYIGEVGVSGKGAMIAVLAITMVKSQLVANYLMGLRRVSMLWRGIMLGYFIIVGSLIAVAYLKVPT